MSVRRCDRAISQSWEGADPSDEMGSVRVASYFEKFGIV